MQNTWLPSDTSLLAVLAGAPTEIQNDDPTPTGWITDWAGDLGTDPQSIGTGNQINPLLANQFLSSLGPLTSMDSMECLNHVTDLNLEQFAPPPVPASGIHHHDVQQMHTEHLQPPPPAPGPDHYDVPQMPPVRFVHYQAPPSQPAPAFQFANYSTHPSTHTGRLQDPPRTNIVRFVPYKDRATHPLLRDGQAEGTRGPGVNVRFS